MMAIAVVKLQALLVAVAIDCAIDGMG